VERTPDFGFRFVARPLTAQPTMGANQMIEFQI